MNTSNLTEYIFYGVILLVAGAAEYLKLAPSGTFFPVLTLVAGHYFGGNGLTAAGKVITIANGVLSSGSRDTGGTNVPPRQ